MFSGHCSDNLGSTVAGMLVVGTAGIVGTGGPTVLGTATKLEDKLQDSF